MHSHPYFVMIKDVCVFKAGGGCQSGGFWSCRTTQGSRLSFHPSVHQQRQRHGPLPGCKPNNNQSSCWLVTPRHAAVFQCLERVMILCLSCNNVICESVSSERVFKGVWVWEVQCLKNLTFNGQNSCNVRHARLHIGTHPPAKCGQDSAVVCNTVSY